MKKLICVPFAGGMARDFEQFCELFPADMEMIRIEYAGHGTRSKEPFYVDVDEMVSDVAEKVNALIRADDEVYLLGYSMGSLVAYELLAQKKLAVQPKAAFFASHISPKEQWPSKHYYLLEDEEFLVKMRAMGGMQKISDKMLENRAFRRMYFEPLREDYRLMHFYECRDYAPLDIPALVFHAPDDIPSEEMQGWKDIFTHDVEIVELGSRHFFIWDEGEAMRDRMLEVMNV